MRVHLSDGTKDFKYAPNIQTSHSSLQSGCGLGDASLILRNMW